MASPDKPHINIGIIGHVDHGKTTLTAAITTTIALTGGTYNRADNEPQEAVYGTDLSSVCEYATEARQYRHVDWTSQPDYIKYMLCDGMKMDALILVVSAEDGPKPGTRDQIALARQVGIPCIVGFLNKCDVVDDEEALGLVEMEMRDMLSQYGFLGDETPIIRGSALKALEGSDDERLGKPAIVDLLRAMERWIPVSVRAVDGPFLMPVEDVMPVSGRGTVVTGCVERGVVRVGDEVDIVGLGAQVRTICTGVEIFRKQLEYGEAGENVGILLRGIKRGDVQRGQVLGIPGQIWMYTDFTAEVYLLSQEEGGRKTTIFNHHQAQFFVHRMEVTGSIALPEGVQMVMAGDHLCITVQLTTPVAIETRMRIAIREEGKTFGYGVVTSIIE
ncbi:elongation factor Tu [Aspergillus bertholletiae]|uniref:Elongation factor Tu, mitochondrial n=1 Tax=Aspergillus bertholletiae TaxID=1226010 RepID=A0A5N7BCJ1_9EURO|nr:elongation factor Tu [Aspergillus bertholletiae]